MGKVGEEPPAIKGGVTAAVLVREYDEKRDKREVEQVENRCEVGPSGKLCLYTDLLGDPICRVRHSPAYRMLVAEIAAVGAGGVDEERREIVGMIRGCIKTVTCGNRHSRNATNIYLRIFSKQPQLFPVYAKLAYISGLRVSPLHRYFHGPPVYCFHNPHKRMGIGLKLVNKMEEWFAENGAEYSYMATENDNQASVNLFTNKCGYSKFRTPSILVQPVFAHPASLGKRVTILRLDVSDAEYLYRRRFSTVEFFPRDIDSVLNNKLNLGTFLAVPYGYCSAKHWPGVQGFLEAPPHSWAVLSLWNCNDVFRLEVRGASRLRKAFAKTTRLVDRALPWLKLPSVPDIFGPFGLYFAYGLGGEGPNSVKLIKALCGLAHNLAKEKGCGVVATEVASHEPLRSGIPHWKSLSSTEDLWCIKRMGGDYSDRCVGDWTKSPPETSIFVDPREL